MTYNQLPEDKKAKIALNWQGEDDDVKCILDANIFDINGNFDQKLFEEYATMALNDKEKWNNLFEIFVSLLR